MSLVNEILASPLASQKEKQDALDRVHRGPGVPTSVGRIESFWLKDPHQTIAKAQSESLPEEVDVAIIGSGITGLSVAWNILKTAERHGFAPPSVTILEARDACSGATGRNGGHVLETVFDYLELKEQFGKDAAIKITKFRLAHLAEMEALVKDKPEILEPSQLRRVEFVSVYFDNETFQEAVDSLTAFKQDMPEESSAFASHTGDKLRTDFHLSAHAIGAITGPAGAAWPYNLVTHLLASLLHDHPSTTSLETNTPVTAITSHPASHHHHHHHHHPYALTTPRGALHARHVVHATDAHAAHLLPSLLARVFPVRGQMSAQDPGARFPTDPARSWLFNYERGFDYLTQLPDGAPPRSSAGELMLGGGLSAARASGLAEVGVARDDGGGGGGLDLGVDVHLCGALEAVFGRERWGASGGVKAMWTGCMGFSADGFPWVGEVPGKLTGRGEAGGGGGKAAEWVAAGFSGEGMVHAWLSGKAVGIMLLVKEGKLPREAEEEVRGWLPEQLWITEERFERAGLPRKVAEIR